MADLRPEAVDIQEGCWPGGMQIGVASRIGYMLSTAARMSLASNSVCTKLRRRYLVSHDYYVVDTVTPTDLPAGIAGESIPHGERIQIYYDASFIHRIALQPDGVRLIISSAALPARVALSANFFHHRPPKDKSAGLPVRKPNIQRRNGLVDYPSLGPP